MYGDQGCIYVVEVHFALCLEFVDVVQESERERSARLFQCCRKPPHTKKLDARWLLLSRFSTVAVVDANGHDTRDVKEGEIYRGRRPRAAFANAMTKLIHGTETNHCGSGKELARPFLGGTPSARG